MKVQVFGFRQKNRAELAFFYFMTIGFANRFCKSET